ncbi:unnamed protein product [Rangifer tarandus platyrhynchus]|uniref:Uncharacterized protein n=1 Tax=Rangifer tarandus platyrhynchus TaxID=3082113 RepID=A0ABN8YW98_RANTA|nr:unnamed protein product [Rangifer tarandus platyrhynchus]
MSSRSTSQEAWSHHHLRRCISMPGALTKRHRPGGSEASTPETRHLPALQAGCLRSGVGGCLPPPRSLSGASFPPLPALGGHSWRSWAGSRVPPASASVVSWASPLESASTVPSACGDTAHGLGPPSDLDLLQGPYFQARSRPQVLSVRVPIYLCGGDTIQPVTDRETPGEQFGDGGQEPGVRRVWLGASVTCLSGDAEEAKRYGAAQL